MPGRKGCVLEGRVALSEELEEKIRRLDGEAPGVRTGGEEQGRSA